ncbi:MAG: hypothetical protein P8188_13275, partial [Gemmatimonadota bacterium]
GLCFTLTSCVGLSVGPMAKYNGPTGDFADTHGSGFTAGAQGEFKLAMVGIYGDAAWTRFSGDGETEDKDGFELAAGGRLLLGPAFIGAQYGYITGDLDQSLLRPELGVHLGPFTAFAQYQTLKKKWWSIGGSFSLF